MPLVIGGVVALAGLLPGGNDIPVNAAVCLVLVGGGAARAGPAPELRRRAARWSAR